MKMFLNTDKKHIDGNNPVETTLDKALAAIDEHPSIEVCEDNHIGFESPQGEVIQFIRFDGGAWLIDAPVLINGQYSHSLQDNDLNIGKVKEIVKSFHNSGNWKGLCNLTRTN